MDSIGRFVFRFSFSLVFFVVVTNLAIFSINFNSFWKFHPLCTLHMYSRGPPIPFHLIRLGCQALIIFAWIGTSSRGRSLRCFLSSSSRNAHRRKNATVPSMSEQRRQGGGQKAKEKRSCPLWQINRSPLNFSVHFGDKSKSHSPDSKRLVRGIFVALNSVLENFESHRTLCYCRMVNVMELNSMWNMTKCCLAIFMGNSHFFRRLQSQSVSCKSFLARARVRTHNDHSCDCNFHVRENRSALVFFSFCCCPGHFIPEKLCCRLCETKQQRLLEDHSAAYLADWNHIQAQHESKFLQTSELRLRLY